jgi:hypothetical protein
LRQSCYRPYHLAVKSITARNYQRYIEAFCNRLPLLIMLPAGFFLLLLLALANKPFPGLEFCSPGCKQIAATRFCGSRLRKVCVTTGFASRSRHRDCGTGRGFVRLFRGVAPSPLWVLFSLSLLRRGSSRLEGRSPFWGTGFFFGALGPGRSFISGRGRFVTVS